MFPVGKGQHRAHTLLMERSFGWKALLVVWAERWVPVSPSQKECWGAVPAELQAKAGCCLPASKTQLSLG